MKKIVFLACAFRFVAPSMALAAGEAAEVGRMFQACINSGGRAASNYNAWVAQNGCICPGSSSGSGQPTCSGASSSSGGTSVGSYNSIQQMQMNLATQVGASIGQALGDAIFGNPQQDAANQAAAAQAAEQRRQAEEQRRAEVLRQQEIAKQRILGQLKGSESAAGLSLKTGDEDTSLTVTESRGAFGSTVITPTGIGSPTSVQGLQLKLGNDDTIKIDSTATSTGGAGLTTGSADRVVSANVSTSRAVSSPPASHGLQLKLGDDAPRVSEGQTVALIPRQGDPEHLAAGNRYVDCDATRIVYARMKKGMAVQRDWLTRTKAQLDGEQRERHELDHAEKIYMVKTLFETAKDMALDMGVLKAELSQAKLARLTPERQKQILDYAEKLSTAYDVLTKSPEAAKAGFELGRNGQEISQDMAEHILSSADSRQYLAALPQLARDVGKAAYSLNQALAESGISEEGGKKLAESAFGPLGALAFSAAKISFIDVPEMVGKDYLNAVQLQQAYSQYDNLKFLYDGLQETIANQHADLVQYCKYRD